MHLSSKLRPKEAAAYLGLSSSTLAKMRLTGDGPIYSKMGRRLVVYEIHNLDAFVAAGRRTSTSDEGEARTNASSPA